MEMIRGKQMREVKEEKEERIEDWELEEKEKCIDMRSQTFVVKD